ncbi:MAG: ribonuclease P protein component [Candidatus Puniceispirillaceae bacterium]
MAKAPNQIVINQRRLQKRGDFLRLQHRGVKQVMPAFILQAGPAPDSLSHIRIGYTASKKIGNAVCRNRAKRRLRALAALALVPAARPNMDYVLIARHKILRAGFAQLEAELRSAMLSVHKKLDNPPQKRPAQKTGESGT